jgi:hypothetical protein
MGLQGETNKYVSVSEARFGNIISSYNFISVEVFGSEGEAVEVSFILPGGDIEVVTCMFRGNNPFHRKKSSESLFFPHEETLIMTVYSNNKTCI